MAQRRSRGVWAWSGLAAVILGLAYGLSPIVPVVLIVGLAIPVLFWRYPRACFYTIMASACMVEAFPLSQPDSLTDRLPIFWNVNTIAQTYAHVDFHGIPLNLMEIMLLTAGFFSVVQSVYLQRFSIRLGALAGPILFYTAFVLMGWANGLATGGDSNFALLEIRPPLYFTFAYLMAANFSRDEKCRQTMLRLVVVCVGIKGILYTYRLYTVMHGTIPDQGVGSHEEVFFFDAFFMLQLLLGLTGALPRMRLWMGLLLWPVLTGHLACNRRAGTAALLIALPVLLILAFAAVPRRRRMIGTVAVILGVLFSIYYPLYRNKTGMWAQPAQAIKSAFEPNARDASSDAYRDGEDQNLMATIKAAPVQGWGFGKRMVIVADLSYAAKLWQFWDMLPHNTLLWIWMRTGTVGFFAFWIMFAAILIYGCQTVREATTPEGQTLALFAASVLVLWVVFGLLDMGFTQMRSVLFSGFAVGMLVGIPRRSADSPTTPDHPAAPSVRVTTRGPSPAPAP
jgi:O-antigen ligase